MQTAAVVVSLEEILLERNGAIEILQCTLQVSTQTERRRTIQVGGSQTWSDADCFVEVFDRLLIITFVVTGESAIVVRVGSEWIDNLDVVDRIVRGRHCVRAGE